MTTYSMRLHSVIFFLLVVLTARIGAQCLPPKNSSAWQSHYSQQLGLCLYTQLESRGRLAFSAAESECRTGLLSGPAQVRLIRADTEEKRMFLFNYLLSRSFGYTSLWTEAFCNVTSSKFHWSNGEPLEGLSCSSSAQRVYFEASLTSSSSFKSEFMTTLPDSGSVKLIPVCEYDAPRCDPSSVAGYSSSTMSLSARAFINQTVRFNCKPGYYRRSEVLLTPASVSAVNPDVIAERHRYFCQFTPSSAPLGGESNFVAIGSRLALETCEPIHCKGSQLLSATEIPDAEDTYKSVVNATKKYAFGEKIPVDCKVGYVSYLDASNSSTEVECGQSDLNPSLGMWMPPSLAVCSAVQCRSPMPYFNPDQMLAYKAFDRSKDRSYSAVESNRFPFYPNVVSLRCRQAGYFFMDRKYDKSLQCTLPGNGSRHIGVWTPVDGTILSGDVMACKKITCLTNEIVIPAQQSDLPKALADCSLNDTLTVTHTATSSVQNLTIREFTRVADMAFGTGVRVYCQYPFEMNVLNAGSGRYQMVTSYEVTCAQSGTWSSKVTACIKRTEAIMLAGGRKYIPPAKEADGAQSLGLVVIIILIVFFSTIIVLDLTTITRDIRLMRRNLGRISIRLRRGKKGV